MRENRLGPWFLRWAVAPTQGDVMTWVASGPWWAPGAGVTVLSRVTANVVIGNSAAEANLVSLSIPAGALGTVKRVRITMEGTYTNNTGLTQTLELRVKYGATTMIDVTSDPITPSAFVRPFKWMAELSARGSTSSQLASLAGQMHPDLLVTATGTAAEDSTAAKTLAVTAQHGNAVSTLTMTLQAALVELV